MFSPSIASTNSPIAARREAVAEWVMERIFKFYPELEKKFEPVGRARTLEDIIYHVTYLSTALTLDRVEFFTDYIDWTRSVLEAHGVSASQLAMSLELIEEKLVADFCDDEDLKAQMSRLFRHAQKQLALKSPPSGVDQTGSHPLESTAREYLDLLLASNRRASKDLLVALVESGVDVRDVYLHIIARSQHLLGVLWQNNRISVAKEHYVTAATQANITSLYPFVFGQHIPKLGRSLVATCIAGELHELGIRMVADFLEMEGWDTNYLGASTPIPDLLDYIEEISPDVLAVSATLSPHVEQIRDLIAQVRAKHEPADLRILVGGRPFNRVEGLWKQIGADAMAFDALSAVQKARDLLGGGETS